MGEITGRVSCIACEATFADSEHYRLHCHEEHRSSDSIFDKFTADFQTLQSFQEWKADTEKRTTASFKHKRTNYGKDNQPVTKYFDCNCTGKAPAEPEARKRSRGTFKMGGRCPAYITLRFQASGLLHVEACLDHLGHDQRLGHLRIPEDLRVSLATQLAHGVDMDAILDRIRDTIDDALDRSHIVQRKDLNNIKHQFNLLHSRKDSNDYVSVLVRHIPIK